MLLKSRISDVYIPEGTSLPSYILDEAVKYGDKKAFIDGLTGKSVTFRELIHQIRTVASALIKRGVRCGDVALIFSPNNLQYPVILYALNYIGAVLSTCNPLYTKGELVNQLIDSKAKYVFTVPSQVDKVRMAARDYHDIKDIFVIGGSVSDSDTTRFEALLQDSGDAFLAANYNPRTQPTILPYSSGTTGRSKGVVLTHHNMISMVAQITHPDVNVMVPGAEVLVCILPCFHIFAICVYLSWCLREGQTSILLPRFELKTYLESIQRYKATMLHMVPPVALTLSQHPLVDKYDLSSVHTVICGAAPLGKDQAEALMKRLNINAVRQGYGLTETSAVTHVAPVKKWKHGSVGLLLPNMECKVIDTESGKLLKANQDGEICIRGPTIMPGYLNRPEATKATIDELGWLHTGDIGHFDEDGHFYIVDRVKELIKYNGYQVPPAELESLILTIPDVLDVAVIGLPDKLAGELPCACVVKRANSSLKERDVEKFVEDRVSPQKRLRGGVIFVKEIAKSASGKILRRVLKENLSKHSSKL